LQEKGSVLEQRSTLGTMTATAGPREGKNPKKKRKRSDVLKTRSGKGPGPLGSAVKKEEGEKKDLNRGGLKVKSKEKKVRGEVRNQTQKISPGKKGGEVGKNLYGCSPC